MDKPDLQKLIDAKVENPGAAATFFELNKEPDSKWLKTIGPGVAASQHIVNEYFAAAAEFAEDVPVAPTITNYEELSRKSEMLRRRLRVPVDAGMDQILTAILSGQWSRRVMMLTPLAGAILPWVHYAHLAIVRKNPWVGYFQATDTILQVARNLCAHAFLKSEAEWSLWVDGDIIPPFGDPAFFYDPNRLGISEQRMPQQFTRMNAVDRLLSHGKTIVGGFYQQRRKGGKICSPLDLNPKGDPNDVVKDVRRNGPRDKLVPVEWCATGCLLVHRKVYEDIMERNPKLAVEGEPFNFFGHEVGRGGEDYWFGKLAKEAGHQSYLDTGVWCAHLGNYPFFPEE